MSSDLSHAASACPMVVTAVRLAEWVGEDGVPVTPGGSLRPADVHTASAALGIVTRAKVRRAADVPEVHRPWLTAVADGIDRIASSGHPHSAAVAEALTAVIGTAIPVQQLKISLSGQCWRRVLIRENATLETLHHVIIALFGWDDDHLHIFTVGRRQYASSFHGLEETVPEHTMRLRQTLPHPRATISYTYDLGASWKHEITLEKILHDHPLPQPECVTGKGDNPIEYYDPDDPEEPVPFDAAAINKRLHKLTT